MAYQSAAASLARVLGAADPATFDAAAAARIRNQVDAVIARTDRIAQVWTRRVLTAAYKAERIVTDNRLAIIGAEKTGRPAEKRHDRTIRKLIKQTLKDLFKANSTFAKVASQYIGLLNEGRSEIHKLQALSGTEEAAIGEMARDAVREGYARQTLKNQIKDFLAKKLNGEGFIVINGRNYNAGKYADLVARVRMREAATEATLNAANDYDHDLVEIPAKGGSCEDCQKIEGKVYSISGKTPGYPVLDEDSRVPIHPNCEHYLRVVSESSLSFRSAP